MEENYEQKIILKKIDEPTPTSSASDKVYLVQGGCVDDAHVIAVYDNEPAALARAKEENKRESALEAYVEAWDILF